MTSVFGLSRSTQGTLKKKTDNIGLPQREKLITNDIAWLHQNNGSNEFCCILQPNTIWTFKPAFLGNQAGVIHATPYQVLTNEPLGYINKPVVQQGDSMPQSGVIADTHAAPNQVPMNQPPRYYNQPVVQPLQPGAKMPPITATPTEINIEQNSI